MIKLTAIYIDESGTTVATDHYRPNEERYEPALKLPTTPARSLPAVRRDVLHGPW